MNVQRQRRKEEALRQEYARQAAAKTNKCDSFLCERDRLKRARQNATLEAGRARAAIKEQINRMRVRNSFSDASVHKTQQNIQKILKKEIFNPSAGYGCVSKFAASKPRKVDPAKEDTAAGHQTKALHSSDKHDGDQIETFFANAETEAAKMQEVA